AIHNEYPTAAARAGSSRSPERVTRHSRREGRAVPGVDSWLEQRLAPEIGHAGEIRRSRKLPRLGTTSRLWSAVQVGGSRATECIHSRFELVVTTRSESLRRPWYEHVWKYAMSLEAFTTPGDVSGFGHP